jgi:alkanesulfonate monooxygenase SsuD/methylene tetrahydromethanopterin reductase-like flavin-dependent oxidoreductase (luciferase family)
MLSFGMALAATFTSWNELEKCAKTLDDGSWQSAWVADHFIPALPGFDSKLDCFEGFAVLSGLAAITHRLRLGAFVAGVTYRNPALLANMAMTIDHISNGRFCLGIGAAHVKREHDAYFGGLPPMGERSDRLQEAAAIIKALFTSEEPVNFEGKYYSLVDAPFSPKCVQTPHVPILVGGAGEQRTLRTLAMYGDVMNVSGPLPVVKRKLEVLERHCEAVGRDPAQIRKTIHHPVTLLSDPDKIRHFRAKIGGGYAGGANFNLSDPRDQERYLAIGTPDHIMEVFRDYEEIGIEEIIFLNTPNHPGMYQELDEKVLSVYQ